ncbi:MAG: hypothetical protein ACXV4B_01635, partial [Halobacteriota archaeon]
GYNSLFKRKMTDYSDFTGYSESPCLTCGELAIFRMNFAFPRCAWHTDGVPSDILTLDKTCSHYVENTER